MKCSAVVSAERRKQVSAERERVGCLCKEVAMSLTVVGGPFRSLPLVSSSSPSFFTHVSPKKGARSINSGRYCRGRRSGIKVFGDQFTKPGSIIVRQRPAKLSASFLEEASLSLSQDGVMKQENNGCQQNVVGTASQLSCNQMEDYKLLRSNNEKLAMVSLDSVEAANSTLEDFCRSYFMFHGLDVSRPQSIFKYLPILSFAESYIYQVDKMNENLLPIQNGESVLGGKDEKVSCFPKDPLRPLVTLLEHKGLLTERIREEFQQGEEYWALERKLCHALIKKEEILDEDVMKAIRLKTFDYRVLNLLLYQLRGEKVEELHMEFLSVSEFLVEVADDLYDYEDDVLENNFNVLRMLVKMYGASTAPAMLAKHIREAEEKFNSLLKSLDPQLSLNFQKRSEEATKEGGVMSGHPRGTWNIPTLIVDEELYRSKWKSDSS